MMTLNPITQQQAQTVAQLTHQLRPGWDVAGIMNVLGRNANRTDAFTLTLAMLAAAQEPTNQTPAVIEFDGKHWERAAAKDARRAAVRPADANPDCPQHPGTLDWQCGPCHERAPKPENFRELVEQAAAAARAERPGGEHAAA